MERIMVIIEDAGTNYSAFFYDYPIITTAPTIADIKNKASEALLEYIEAIKESEAPLPTELKGEYKLHFYQLVEV